MATDSPTKEKLFNLSISFGEVAKSFPPVNVSDPNKAWDWGDHCMFWCHHEEGDALEYAEETGETPETCPVCGRLRFKSRVKECCDEFDGAIELAEEYVDSLRWTEEPRPYDYENEFRATPEDYEWGCKTSNTPNSYRCYLRHECMNYDELIESLDRDDYGDRIIYQYVSRAVEELIQKAEQIGYDFPEVDWI